MNDRDEGHEIIKLLEPHIKKMVRQLTRDCLRAKIATVTAVRGNRADVLINGEDVATNVLVARALVLSVGEQCLVEYANSLSNSIIRTVL